MQTKPSSFAKPALRKTIRRELYPGALAAMTTLAIEPLLRTPYLSTATWLREFNAWPAPTRLAWQHARLAEILTYASLHVPYYRSRIATPVLDARAAIEGLAPVDKGMIRVDLDQFLSDECADLKPLPKRTGGSTGDPFHYPLDRRAWTQMYAAQLHFFERAGVRYGEPVLSLGIPPIRGVSVSWKQNLRRRLERTTLAPTSFEVEHDASLRRAVEAERAGASLWYGYAGTIAAMAHAVNEEGVTVRGPVAVVTMAEPLRPGWKEAIETAFHAPVYDEYGCNDGGLLAQSCERGRFHLAENVSIVEVLDGGDPCPPGVEGDVAITNLHSRALPFIRYRNGDRAVLGEGTCPCGRSGATLERMAGRTGDRVELPDGTLMSLMTFAQVFKRTPGVRRWQVVQPDRSRLVVRLDVGPDFDAAQRQTILDYVRKWTSNQVDVEVDLTEPIELTPAGKHKVVVRLEEAV